MTAPPLVLYHDYTSPASYVAVARAQRLADEGLRIEFHGIEAVGLDVTLPPTLDVLAELDRVRPDAEAEGLVLTRPAAVPPTARAHLVGEHADDRDLGASWRNAVYAAYWAGGGHADLADPTVLAELAGVAGLDPDEVVELLADAGATPRWRQAQAGLRGEGVGGVPTLRAMGTFVPGLLSEADLRALAAYA